MEPTSATKPRALPANLEAERSILSAILLDNTCLATAIERLRPEDFFLEAHQVVFRAVLDLFNRGQPCDFVTLTEALHRAGALDTVGGPAFVNRLLEFTGTTAGLRHYIDIVREKSLIRQMIRAATEIATEGYDETLDVAEYLDQSEKRLFGVLERDLRGAAVDIHEVLAETIEKLERRYDRQERVIGLPTGYDDLDRLLLGLHPSDLVIIAARPSMGKTAFALNVAANVALAGHATVVYSLEMSNEQLAMRLLSAESRVGLQKIRQGLLADTDWPKVTGAVTKLAQAPLAIDDTPGISITELRAKSRRLKLEGRCDLILVDYLQLMRSGQNGLPREQEIAEISRGLKNLAKELSVPVVALSQLNRELERRENKRPILSDLRESGSIEQDADVILFIYRDEVYNKDTDRRGIAEIVIGKQRNGPTDTLELVFFREITRFDNYVGDRR